MYDLRLLHESVVLDEEIDALGHMNVRHYGERALAATANLLEQIDLPGLGVDGITPGVHDLPGLYTRYQREQLAGSPLEVHGGILDATERGLRFYHELRNPVREEIAATFMHDVRFPNDELEEPPVIEPAIVEALLEQRIVVPEHGRPRSIDLDASTKAPTLEDALEHGMAMRKPRTIDAELCDETGRVSADHRPFIMWGGEPLDGSEPGPPVYPLEGGGRMGWASLEMRSVRLAPLRQGTRIQSFGAPVQIMKKTSLRRFWVFDLDTGKPLLANDVVDIALHLDERRAMEIPEKMRAQLEATLRADLR
ncbi:MAG: thioesterase family protein [Myxococcota bacterium]